MGYKYLANDSLENEPELWFDVTATPDPFYSEANMNRLRKAISGVETGKAKLTEHELIELADD